jgi:hypothetical protein
MAYNSISDLLLLFYRRHFTSWDQLDGAVLKKKWNIGLVFL